MVQSISTQWANPWEVYGAVLLMAAMTHDSLLSLTFPHLCPPPSDIIGNVPSFREMLEVPAGKWYLSVRTACVCMWGGGEIIANDLFVLTYNSVITCKFP